MGRTWLVVVGGCALVAASVLPAAAGGGPAGLTRAWAGDATWRDFDGDGFADLAIGAPNDRVDGLELAGSVSVLYGSSTGLTAAGSQVWHQGTTGILDVPETGDEFGGALATGDFDDDGFGDLAIGVPGEDRGAGGLNRGAVAILFGGPTGLTATGDLLLSLPTGGCSAASQAHWRFGAALAVSDYGEPGEYFRASADGHADLAIGVPGFDDCDGGPRRGKVSLFWGDDNGEIPLDHATLFCTPFQDESDTGCGEVLRYGDLNGDDFPDLVMGVPRLERDRQGDPAQGTDPDPSTPNGALGISYNNGSPDMLWAKANVRHDLKAYGSAIAVGDVNADGRDDLVVGAPGAFDQDIEAAGAIVLYEGAAPAIVPADGFALGQSFGSSTLLDEPEAGDRFGASLAIGNVGRGSPTDLVIGAPGEAVGGDAGAGVVFVVYGRDDAGDQNLHLNSAVPWSQDTAGVADAAEAGDRFGWALAIVRNLGKGGAGDLVVGVPREAVSEVTYAGLVAVFYGTSASGLSAANDQVWHRDIAGVAGAVGTKDELGLVLP